MATASKRGRRAGSAVAAAPLAYYPYPLPFVPAISGGPYVYYANVEPPSKVDGADGEPPAKKHRHPPEDRAPTKHDGIPFALADHPELALDADPPAADGDGGLDLVRAFRAPLFGTEVATRPLAIAYSHRAAAVRDREEVRRRRRAVRRELCRLRDLFHAQKAALARIDDELWEDSDRVRAWTRKVRPQRAERLVAPASGCAIATLTVSTCIVTVCGLALVVGPGVRARAGGTRVQVERPAPAAPSIRRRARGPPVREGRGDRGGVFHRQFCGQVADPAQVRAPDAGLASPPRAGPGSVRGPPGLGEGQGRALRGNVRQGERGHCGRAPLRRPPRPAACIAMASPDAPSSRRSCSSIGASTAPFACRPWTCARPRTIPSSSPCTAGSSPKSAHFVITFPRRMWRP